MTAAGESQLEPPVIDLVDPSIEEARATIDMVVVVGTDHHPFHRLIRWVDEWTATQGPGFRAVVQHGATSGPIVADGRPLIPHHELQELMAAAAVVVTHGGPASIIEARRHGKVPVVVPRSPARGEHVDGHQLRFSRRLAELGLVALCETQEVFVATLEAAIADPGHLEVRPRATDLGGAADSGAGVEAVKRIVDDLIAASATRTRRRLLHRRASRR